MMNDRLENIELGSALLKGSFLLLAAFMSATLLCKASATSLYRVWFLGFCMALVVTVVSTIAPICNLALPIVQMQVAAVSNGSLAPSSATQESQFEFAALSKDKINQVASLSSVGVDEFADGVNRSEQRLSNFQESIVGSNQSTLNDLKPNNQIRSIEVASIVAWKPGLHALT